MNKPLNNLSIFTPISKSLLPQNKFLFNSSDGLWFQRHIPEIKPIYSSNKNYINRNESSNKQNNTPLAPQTFCTPLNQQKGRNLLQDFEKISIKKQNEITANKKDYLDNHKDKTQLKNNNTKKFFTECGLGYRCSCSKTHCNKYYCECFREGRYCVNCDCTDCQNKRPENVFSDKHPQNESDKKNFICCTCTKTGCNKKYCECYKNGLKCHSECRCLKCENKEKNKKKVNFNGLKCCLEIGVYVIKRKIYEQKFINKKRRIEKKKLEYLKNKDGENLLFNNDRVL